MQIPDLFHLFTQCPQLYENHKWLEKVQILHHFTMKKVLADWNQKQHNLIPHSPSSVKSNEGGGTMEEKTMEMEGRGMMGGKEDKGDEKEKLMIEKMMECQEQCGPEEPSLQP